MKSKHLSQRTRHLAILLMDIYVSKTYVSPHDYEFVLVVCLLIAGLFCFLCVEVDLLNVL